MQSDKHLDNPVLLYLFLLILFVVINMFNDVDIFDVIYLVVLLCSVLKYFMVMRENRK